MSNAASESDIRAALASVCESDLFSPLERLRAFLTYIVEEELAGRGELIRGKTIAQDVYERMPDEGTDADNVVRVDARRLRQTLDHYYGTAGAQDPVRIHVDTGGYRPRFETVEADRIPAPPVSRRPVAVAVVSFAAGAVLGAGVFLLTTPGQDATDPNRPFADTSGSVVERQAIRDKSPASLQAVNLAEQARGMIFPIFDRPRQELVNEVFHRVVELDPDYFGGYAGAAQTTATLAILSPSDADRDRLGAEALQHAETAIRLEPTDPWAQSAMGWAKFATRDFDAARRYSARAAALAPEDGDILDVHGSVSLFTGQFKDAAAAAEKAMNLGGSGHRLANRNILGAASFHLGDYQASYDALIAAADFGAPISAPSFAYQAAALQALGRTREAARKAEELKRAWPNADIETMLKSIFADPGHVDDLVSRLAEIES